MVGTGIETLVAKADALAARAVTLQWQATPALTARYGENGRQKCADDTRKHLSFLLEALRGSSYLLFGEYVVWAKILLENLGLLPAHFRDNLLFLAMALRESDSGQIQDLAVEYLERAAKDLEHLPSETRSYIQADSPLYTLTEAYLADLLAGDRRTASKRILHAVSEGTTVADVYRHIFIPTQRELGRLWQINKITVAQEHFCTAVTQLIMCQLYPHILSVNKNGKVFVGACIAGELHELGIRMVTDFFEMAGWDTHFLGANTPAGSILDHLETVGADIVGISATITPHVDLVRQFIQQLKSRPALKTVRVLAGGYPFNLDTGLWQSVGADGYASNADEAIIWASQICKQVT